MKKLLTIELYENKDTQETETLILVDGNDDIMTHTQLDGIPSIAVDILDLALRNLGYLVQRDYLVSE